MFCLCAHQVKQKAVRFRTAFLVVDPPGFEPGQAEPKSAVLPLHHGSIRFGSAKIIYFFIVRNILGNIYH